MSAGVPGGRGTRAAVVALVGCVLLAACGSDPADSGAAPTEGAAEDADLAAFYDQELQWEECGTDFDCATFTVPLDYADPEAGDVEIAVRRSAATGGDSTGSLIINPGGPGGSGVDYVGQARSTLSERLRENFDVVGFDPRGVGLSEPLECLDTPGLDDYLGQDLDTDEDGTLTEAGVAELDERNAEFIAGCEADAGPLLEHVGTDNVARDMDILRALLGDDQLTYLGKSYGTYLGAHYAALFPDRIRAAVLDGALDPTLSGLEVSTQQVEGFQAALEAFVADCLTHADCALVAESDGTQEGALAALEELIASAGEEPLANTTGDGREVNAARVELGLLSALYSQAFWPVVRDALAAAYDGDGTELLALGDRLYGRTPDGAYENSASALVAVNCTDRPSPDDVAAYQAAAETAAETSPIFGPSLAWGSYVCADWPETERVDQDFSAAGADPILVVGTTRDSATPYAWAERLAAELDSGALLTYDGDGHTAYGFGDSCVDETVDAYLIDGEVPADGTVCPDA